MSSQACYVVPRAFLFLSLLLSTSVLADQNASSSQLLVTCPPKFASLIPLTSRTASSSTVVKAYMGIIDDAEGVIDLASLKEALSKEAPFTLTGRGQFWPETQKALVKLEQIVDESKASGRLRGDLLSALRQRLEESKKRGKQVRRKTRTKGKAPPLKLFTPLPNGPKLAMSLKVSPDGKHLVVVGEKGEVLLYRLRKEAPTKAYQKRALYPDADWLYESWVLPGSGNQYGIWPIYPIKFSADSSSFFTSVSSISENPKSVFVQINTLTGRIMADFSKAERFAPDVPPTRWGNQIILSPNEDTAALQNYSDILWRLDTKQVPIAISTCGIHRSGVFSEDGRFYFSSEATGGVRAYDIEQGAELLVPIGDPGPHYVYDIDPDTGEKVDPDLSGLFKRRSYFQLEDGAHFIQPFPGKSQSLLGLHSRWDYGDKSRRNRKMSLVEFDYSGLDRALTDEYLYDGVNRFSNIRYVKKNAIRRRVLSQFPIPRRAGSTFRAYHNPGGLLVSPTGKYIVVHNYISERSGENPGVLRGPIFKSFVDIFKSSNWESRHRELANHKGAIKKMEFTSDERYFLTLTTEGTLRVFEVGSRGGFKLIGQVGKSRRPPHDKPILDFSVSPDLRRIYVIQEGKAYFTPFFGQ